MRMEHELRLMDVKLMQHICKGSILNVFCIIPTSCCPHAMAFVLPGYVPQAEIQEKMSAAASMGNKSRDQLWSMPVPEPWQSSVAHGAL